jgi:outer membrane lipoprotein SlyB
MLKIAKITFMLALLGLISCAQNISPNTYSTNEVGVVSRVKKGTIASRRMIDIDNKSGVGGLAGTAAGAAGGAAAGNNVTTSILGGIGGALIGGVVGGAIDKTIHHQRGYEYIINLDDGKTVSVVQNQDVVFDINQKVLIVYGAMTRIIPDEASL